MIAVIVRLQHELVRY